MAREGLEYTIKVRDEGKGVLRAHLGELSNWSSKATRLITAPIRAITSLRGVGLQANINMIRGLAGRIDELVDKGSRLSLIEKSFRSLSGTSQGGAARLARDIRDAANGALSLSQSMQIANRALASGLSANDIKTTLDFVSKKAFTIGKDMGQAIDTMVTGLSRGSTLFLDDYGILVDGIDQVRRDFDAMQGSGAFDSLGPAAQKAEIIRAAMIDMRRQTDKLGVSGNEMAFQWAAIKSSVADAMDKMSAATGNNAGFQNIFKNIATVTDGLAGALKGPDQEAAFDNLLTRGKQLLGGMFLDVGELLAHGAMKGFDAAWPRILAGGQKVLGGLADIAIDTIERVFAHVTILLGEANLPFVSVGGEAMSRSRNRLAQPAATGLDLSGLREVFSGEMGQPFSRSRSALQGLADDYTGNQYGRDEIEKLRTRAGGQMTRGERLRLQRELARAERQRRRLARRDPDGRRSGRYQAAGREQFDRDLAVMPELDQLSRSERREYINKYAQEIYQADLGRADARIASIRQRLNPRTAIARPPALPQFPATQPASASPQAAAGPGFWNRLQGAVQGGLGGISFGMGTDRPPVEFRGGWRRYQNNAPAMSLRNDPMIYDREHYSAPGVPRGMSAFGDALSWAGNNKWMSPREKGVQKIAQGIGTTSLSAVLPGSGLITTAISAMLNTLGLSSAAQGSYEVVTGRELHPAKQYATTGVIGGARPAAAMGSAAASLSLSEGATLRTALKYGTKLGGKAGLIGALGAVAIDALLDQAMSGIENGPQASAAPAAASGGQLDRGAEALESMSERFVRAARRSDQAAAELAKVIAEI